MQLSQSLVARVLFIFCPLFNQCVGASIVKKKCGEYIYMVERVQEDNSYGTRFNLYFKKTNEAPSMFYSVPLFNIVTSCIKNSKGEYLFLFNEGYGGNATPEDVYGLFDPNRKKLLLKPIDTDKPVNNDKEVDKIIGYSLPLLDDSNFFCCSDEQWK